MRQLTVSLRALLRVAVIAVLLTLLAQTATAQSLYFEGFNTDVFTSGSLTRSDTSVSIDVSKDWLQIGMNGLVDDFADKSGPFTLPLLIEWRVRTFSGIGSYFSLPKLELWFGPSSNDSYSITYVQDDESGNPADDGWLFNGWSDTHTLGTTAWDQWRTVRAVIRCNGGELYAKLDGDLAFTPIMTRTWSVSSEITRIRLSQHSDDVSDFDYIVVAPAALICGDANNSESVNISDAVYIINYIFGGGPAPCASCQ